ncbi:hypothetical protein [Pseudoclavibacter sp. 8L]|uniref:hypothetical protein n=1 Tax=Pseudoclavibacter sp. 8L TaxID=2653162 RepID=UPI001358CBAF|nr:hypothetical protein [Pseudoclavibacter sp. 8L]
MSESRGGPRRIEKGPGPAAKGRGGIALVLGIALAFGGTLTACTPTVPPSEPGDMILPGPGPASTTTTDTTVLYAAGREPTAIMEARVGGTLALSEGGCWVVETGEGQTFVQFPFGSSLTPGGQSINVPGFATVGVGDSIDGSGGYGSAPADAPEACGAPGQPMVFWQSA